ncbi:amidohydrolase family protein [Trichlorobacter lovleyi]|uniref:amidohydrolase family protein n=1 Tax=Trichlorobacter lovleyi TaxID=313985 RepID=UPI0023F08C8E|nr:amidohydrolase family protein [Trichlorobacter lovleyi]
MAETLLYTASWLYSPGRPPIAGGAVAVRDGRIVEIGTARELIAGYGQPTGEYPGCVLMPGFVNAHTHLELTHFPAWRLRDGLDYHPHRFVDWIIQMIKVRRGVTPEETRVSLKAGINACLRAGTTSVGDIVTAPDLLSAYDGSSIGGRIYLELIGQDRQIFEPRLTKAMEAIQAINGPRLPGLSPHAPYTLNSNLLADIAAAARQGCLPLSLHLAESRDESDLLFDSSGPLAEEMYPLVGWQDFLPSPRRITPARFFDTGGLLGASTLAVHGVQLTPADAALLQERGVSICLCPRSNERLAVGTAPVHLFKKLGIPLCLGTDSLASNDSLSLWDEIRFALDRYKGELGPEKLLEMATQGGAAGIGMAGQVGTLDAGKRADFQLVELDGVCTAERLLETGRVNAVYLRGNLAGLGDSDNGVAV